MSRIPDRIDFGQTVDGTLNAIVDNYIQFNALADAGKPALHDKAGRYACGYPIPPFQRQLVWSTDQELRFIESLWLGINPGSYTLHDSSYLSDGTATKFSGWVIDGQQRLTTIQHYLDDKLRVFGLLYSELTDIEKRRFRMIKFPYTITALWNEEAIKELYNRMAFGGTPHKPEDVA
jgi:hypothetical protein